MGWWKVAGTQHTIGDGPLDSLGAAVVDVVEQYQAALGRQPTTAEWEALLFAVLGAASSDAGILERETVKGVTLHVDKG
jgi:hypothetical protein